MSMSMDLLSGTNIDEGFSEETRSASEYDMVYDAVDPMQHALQFGLALSSRERLQLVQALVRSLSNRNKEAVRAHVVDLTHFDPATHLPKEIMLQVLSYLSPADLIAASTVSRAWRNPAQDERLWQCCFAREGWVLDKAQLQDFERKAEGRRAEETAAGTRPSTLERRGSRKRKTDEAFSDGDAAQFSPTASVSSPGQDTGEAMDGVQLTSADPDFSAMVEPMPYRTRNGSLLSADATPSAPCDLKLSPTRFVNPDAERPKLSWLYMYKQRRRLEANWDKGQYKMFRLPHPDFPEEGHKECVYAIQHTSRHIVSGSRDCTIRVWDIDTCRLKMKPLRGHTQSVLCLQFDERPDHDIIVSGGSDSYMIIWRFSTGAVIKRIQNPHGESVLNLRFDDRYIVACSKDKTIKVWNRRALDRNDPSLPAPALSLFQPMGSVSADGLLAEHSLLMTLSGHHAAVNAVMIHDDIIVSASGDRAVFGWDIKTGAHIKTYSGHNKGIACVQFDGRRVVSGSSDNSVRICDALTQAEVACLSGHQNLVRTVQTRFGDLATTTPEELLREARAADEGYRRALTRSMHPALQRGRPRNAGSSNPEDMDAIGAAIPPGGGGTRWARIVSGSYDETIIIWKRDYEGKWQIKHRLQQDVLLRSSRTRRHNHPFAGALQQSTAGGHNQQRNASIATPQAQSLLVAAQNHLASVSVLLAQPALAGAAPAATSSAASLLSAQNTLVAHLSDGPVIAAHASRATNNTQIQANVGANAQQPHPSAAVGAAAAAAGTAAGTAAAPVAPGTNAATVPQAGSQSAMPPTAAPAPAPAPAGAANQQPHAPRPAHRDSYRVFKLQFDARRIVCCSQNRVIVGWDFANGDEDLERIGDWSVETA